MVQTPMQYKTFVWPNNPTTYNISFHRNTVVQTLLDGSWKVQECGRTARVFTGEGVFFGEKAYENFQKLANLFYKGGAGTLSHPQWMTTQAHLSELSLTQEPRENFVRYRFTFIEAPVSAEG